MKRNAYGSLAKRKELLSDRNTPQEVVDAIYETSEEWEIRLLAAKRGLSREAWKRAIEEERSWYVVKALLRKADEEGLRYFYEVRPDLREALLEEGITLPNDLVLSLIEDPNRGVRMKAIYSFADRKWVVERALEKGGQEALLSHYQRFGGEFLGARLAKDPNPNVRAGVASAWRTPAELLADLAKDPDPRVRACVAQALGTPPEVLTDLAKDPDPRVRIEAGRNPNLPEEALEALVEDPEPEVRVLSAGSKKREVLLRLIQDPDPRVVSGALSYAKGVLTFEEVARLLHHPDPEVVGGVLQGWGASVPVKEVLGILRKEHPQNRGVHYWAVDALRKTGAIRTLRNEDLLLVLESVCTYSYSELPSVIEEVSFDPHTLRTLGGRIAPLYKGQELIEAFLKAALRTEGISLEEIESFYEKEVRPRYEGRTMKENLFKGLISPNITPTGQQFFVKHAPEGALWRFVEEVSLAEEVLIAVFKRIARLRSNLATKVVEVQSPLPPRALEVAVRVALSRWDQDLLEALVERNVLPQGLSLKILAALERWAEWRRQKAVHLLLRRFDVPREVIERYLLQAEDPWEISGAFLGAVRLVKEDPSFWPLLRKGAGRLLELRVPLYEEEVPLWVWAEAKGVQSPHFAPSFLTRVARLEKVARETLVL